VETETALEPDPALASTAGDCDPYDVVVPYSKWYVVDDPLGSTLPFNVALVSPTDVAEPVVTAGFISVAKVRSDPTVVPPEFVATSRK
jgi:hypothetical protein